jgi:type IV pilus assembly protein PilQ
MKHILSIFLIFLINFGFTQSNDTRISTIKNQLDMVSVDNTGLTEKVRTEISVSNISLSNFLLAISNIHKININLAPDLEQINIVNNFSNVTVADLLVFLCKEYQLTIDFTGNILSIKKYSPPIEEPEKRFIPITYNPEEERISIDVKQDALYDVFKRITAETGKNLVFTPGMEQKSITYYVKEMALDAALDKMALANNMFLQKTKDGFYVFEDITSVSNSNGPLSSRGKSTINFKILDLEDKLLEVDFNNVPIQTIINEIGAELNIDIFTASPLQNAGSVTFKTKSITFDSLLVKIFESQTPPISAGPTINNVNNNTNNPNQTAVNPIYSSQLFTFKKEGNTYFFGTENQLSVRHVEIIHLQHRSVELLSDPMGGENRNRTVGRTNVGLNNYNNTFSTMGGYNNYNNNTSNSNPLIRNNREPINMTNTNSTSYNNYESKVEALLSILPDDIKKDLDVKIDYELNSFYVLGSSTKIERFKEFVKKIDRPVPVILIEVMLIEVNKSATVEMGVSWGIGDSPAKTKGSIFPETDLTLGANTINRVLNGFDGFGQINLGKVVPNFFATIKAMERNGNIKIRSTPKLSTLNGHRATFSNGQTSYYAVRQRNIYGTDNPQTSEITNYEPIDAELGLTIKPLVSGDGQVTLDIFVVQSSFGERIAEDAPPDLSSREFSSIIRVQDQDIVVLGGLEEQVKNDSGSGVPLLARVPLIKWLFSKRKREDSTAKLTVLIKPTVIY